MPQRIQRKRTKDPRPDTERPCYQGCGERAVAGQNGYCGPVCRFWSKVLKTETCWIWQGARHNSKGYGRLDAMGVRWLAHRYAYALLIGPIGDGLELDHLCQNTGCVNPRHLEPVTSEEHAQRTEQGAYQTAKTRCPAGHVYDEENTNHRNGRRHCRACERVRSRRYRDAQANTAA